MGLFSKLFGKKKKEQAAPEKRDDEVWFTLHVNARLQPTTRGEYFEKPLDEFMHELKIGEVTGGGTLLEDNGGGPISCDVEISCKKGMEQKFADTVTQYPFLPKGSSLIFDDEEGKEQPAGSLEGFALYLNGVDLPKETYEKYPIDPFVEELGRLMGDELVFFDFWKGPREMCLYFYGKSFENMKAATAEFIKTCPLCEKSRIDRLC